MYSFTNMYSIQTITAGNRPLTSAPAPGRHRSANTTRAAGAVPHNHPWHEAFYVLAGQITFGIGDSNGVTVLPPVS